MKVEILTTQDQNREKVNRHELDTDDDVYIHVEVNGKKISYCINKDGQILKDNGSAYMSMSETPENKGESE